VEIRELRVFVTVVEDGGLSAAARRLHVSQSALSQTMRSLERQLGQQLLIRDHAGARPTEAGAVLLREARAVIARYDQMMTTIAGPSGRVAGHLRIGVPLEFPVDLLPTALARLATEHPATTVELLHSSSSAQLAALRSGELDVALVRDRPVDSNLDAVLAVRESMGVILTTARSSELAGPRVFRWNDWPGWSGSPSRVPTPPPGTTRSQRRCADTEWRSPSSPVALIEQ
jgi:DNA-binding transcriptional LysR family regulator